MAINDAVTVTGHIENATATDGYTLFATNALSASGVHVAEGRLDANGNFTITLPAGSMIASQLVRPGFSSGGTFNGCTINLHDPAPDGSHQWSKRYGGAAEDQSTAIACDGNNNVVFTGVHFSPIDFGGGVFTPAATAYNAFVVKLSAAGAYVWAKSFGNAGGTTATGVATDSTGSMLFGGGFGRTLDFGGGPVTSKGDSNSFLVKFSPTGAFAWALRGGGHDGTSGGDLASGLAVDLSDQVVLLGSLATTDADFGGPVLATAGGSDLFLAKYTAAGSYLWSQRLGGVKDDSPTGVVTAPNGDLLVSGTTTGSLDPGGGVITAASTLDGFILRRAP